MFSKIHLSVHPEQGHPDFHLSLHPLQLIQVEVAPCRGSSYLSLASGMLFFHCDHLWGKAAPFGCDSSFIMTDQSNGCITAADAPPVNLLFHSSSWTETQGREQVRFTAGNADPAPVMVQLLGEGLQPHTPKAPPTVGRTATNHQAHMKASSPDVSDTAEKAAIHLSHLLLYLYM